eukprot:gnl/TRDRNA2_/TRDRNA2_92361_c1_seq1.p2 gnl/TRDRNA2_/TRDRNA2_92361_c1~~gnl/TRDRNA2_/TRDRNA2_92361_c1_seq1.p2  ORF type:complete len:116 (-),score=4.72 gnl/TRDRNA2_/TRDRNA2_92361_c1_seq1:113-460(-)
MAYILQRQERPIARRQRVATATSQACSSAACEESNHGGSANDMRRYSMSEATLFQPIRTAATDVRKCCRPGQQCHATYALSSGEAVISREKRHEIRVWSLPRDPWPEEIAAAKTR